MRRLIDDLLTYATARDAAISPVAVELQALTAEVVAERTAHLRNPTDGQVALFPDVYTGPLPTVHADPVLLRQLLDNPIGNALKYTLPGQRARIDISAHHRPGDTHARIQIADRGIGIPAADQAKVFDTFHRSAAHTRNCAGTGLGLAICKKIAERHDGSIRAADNPGGGTRILLTLPTGAPVGESPDTTEPARPQNAPHRA
ncbi:ATP-binding protein [Actinoplanes sp. NPDC051475]|uniref:sensor histidine kinase n=1 Tax=Actinoplanes sp. NPDC051475 TaxID=3157225 RepID=UPI0034500469